MKNFYYLVRLYENGKNRYALMQSKEDQNLVYWFKYYGEKLHSLIPCSTKQQAIEMAQKYNQIAMSNGTFSAEI